MKTRMLPYVVGPAIIVVAILTMAISANSKPTQPKVPTRKPPLPTPPRPTGVLLEQQVITPGTGNLALDIVNDVAATNRPEVGKQQSVWLRDNGYEMTADALVQWADGEIGIDAVRLIARNEGSD